MPRNIRMYDFHSAMALTGLARRLSEAPPGGPAVEVNGKREHTTITVGRRQERDSVTGRITVPEVVRADEEVMLSHSAYWFHLSKKNRLAVVTSSKDAPFRAIRDALDGDAVMSAMVYEKRAMARVAEAIRTKADCIIYDPRFEFEGIDGYDGLARSGFTVTRNRCATTRIDYGNMLKSASMLEPILRVRQADGICDEVKDTGMILKVSRHFGFSAYVDIALESWIQFLEAYVLPAMRDAGDNGTLGD